VRTAAWPAYTSAPPAPLRRCALLTETRARCAAIAATAEDWYERAMEELFGDPAYKGFVLQDRKRLPARFFARITGALTSRLA
jgi:hypothetical protein